MQGEVLLCASILQSAVCLSAPARILSRWLRPFASPFGPNDWPNPASVPSCLPRAKARPGLFLPTAPKLLPPGACQLGPALRTFSSPAAWEHLAFLLPTLPPRRNPTARLEEWQPLCITKTSASWWESGAKNGPERRPIFPIRATRPGGRARPGWGRGLGGRGQGPGPGSGAGPGCQIPEAQLSGAAG